MKYMTSCKSCMANKGVKRISPGDPVYKGKYWQVEHMFYCGLKGWLVLLPKRHVSSIYNLTKKEMGEFSTLFPILCKSLYDLLRNEKEYVMQFAEARGFNHVHFHIVAKPKYLPKRYLDTNIFKLATKAKSLSKEEIMGFSKLLNKRINKLVRSIDLD